MLYVGNPSICHMDFFFCSVPPFLYTIIFLLFPLRFPSPLSLSGTRTVLRRGGSRGVNTPASAAAAAAGSVLELYNKQYMNGFPTKHYNII